MDNHKSNIRKFMRPWYSYIKSNVEAEEERVEMIDDEVIEETLNRLRGIAASVHMTPVELIEQIALELRVKRAMRNIEGLSELKRRMLESERESR